MIDRPAPEVGKRPLLNQRDCYGYVRLVNERGVSLSLHDSAGNPGHYWLSTANIRGDYLPARLTLEEVKALRAGCDLILADHDESTDPDPDPALETETATNPQ